MFITGGFSHRPTTGSRLTPIGEIAVRFSRDLPSSTLSVLTELRMVPGHKPRRITPKIYLLSALVAIQQVSRISSSVSKPRKRTALISSELRHNSLLLRSVGQTEIHDIRKGQGYFIHPSSQKLTIPYFSNLIMLDSETTCSQ